jgi:hypothetical protein
MYTLIKAIGVRIGVNQRWENIGLTDHRIVDIFHLFRKCYLTLTYGTTPVTVYLDMDNMRVGYGTYTGSLADMLVINGNTTLPTVNSLPDLNVRSAKFRDAYVAGYKTKSVHPLYGENSAPDTRSAVLLTRNNPTVDYTDFHNHCLVSVNGFYHMIDTNGTDGILVKDAMKSLRVSNQNQMGILSFKKIGSIKYIPITEDMISKHTLTEPYRSSMYLTIDEDLTNKSALLVIGGYLHVNDNLTYTQVGVSEFKIDFSNYPILDRFYESSNYLDMSSLPLSTTPRNKSQIDINELTGDACMKAFMTLSQSFFVIVDAPELVTNKQYIKRSNLFGMYTSYITPTCPLVTGLGRHPEYIARIEDGQYSITVQDNTVQNRIYNTALPNNLPSVANNNLPSIPQSASTAYFLEILRDI